MPIYSATALFQNKVSQDKDRAIKVHYYRKDANYQGWGLHIWGDCQLPTEWSQPLQYKRAGDEVVFEVPVKDICEKVGFIIHKKDEISSGGDEVMIPGQQKDIWLIANSKDALMEKPDYSKVPFGDLYHQKAHWVDQNEILWRYQNPTNVFKENLFFKLFYSDKASIFISEKNISGYDGFYELSDTNNLALYPPHLLGTHRLRFNNLSTVDEVRKLVKSQLAIVVQDQDGVVMDASGVQVAGVLDLNFYYDGQLGDYVDQQDNYNISVWAPTASQVELLHYSQLVGGEPEVIKMNENDKGVWSIQRPKEWEGHAYQYRLSLYGVGTQKMEQYTTTDPYSKCTTSDGERTIIVDINNPQVVPNNWEQHKVPAPPENPVDISLYELHIRDFSITDSTVPEKLRGKYQAFDAESLVEYGVDKNKSQYPYSNGLKHLKQLAEAGLNHVHLLPLYDYGSVPEKESDQWSMDINEFKNIEPDSKLPQEKVTVIMDRDGFNWGYDPVHFSTPEGSYSTDPDSTVRILECRQTVKGLHDIGLRVVLDVVYNHTFASGQTNKYSVLDKVVPGYYFRRFENGDICNSTCCNNTASEHKMFEKMIVDDVVFWAKNYKIDGYRFDIMAALMLSTMQKCRSALDELTVEKDGVDGKNIYIYGEPWGFGEFSNNQRGENAEQQNLAGTGIGAFNDRIRNATMGGSPFSDVQTQGILTGLGVSPTEYLMDQQGPIQKQMQKVIEYADWVKLSLAGLLKDYEIIDQHGEKKKGESVFTDWGPPVAYCKEPQENINYISCHDNITLFDQIILRTPPHLNLKEKLKVHYMGLALVAFGQGLAFFHAGCEILRSKSLDRDSYNSGDYFNRVDWSYGDNNFAIGLPVASKNLATWPIKSRYLTNPDFKPTKQDITNSLDYFKMLLKLRYSSPLFRLRTSADIQNHLTFYNNGPTQVPAVIAFRIQSSDNPQDKNRGPYDANYKSIIVIFNMRPEAINLDTDMSIEKAGDFKLHPMLKDFKEEGGISEKTVPSFNQGVLAFQVDKRSTAVFVESR